MTTEKLDIEADRVRVKQIIRKGCKFQLSESELHRLSLIVLAAKQDKGAEGE